MSWAKIYAMIHRQKKYIENIYRKISMILKMGELSTPTSGPIMNNFRIITEILQSQIESLPLLDNLPVIKICL